MSFSFVRCPFCDEVFDLIRFPPSGKRGKPDSNKIFCRMCKTKFRTNGETWREAHGERM